MSVHKQKNMLLPSLGPNKEVFPLNKIRAHVVFANVQKTAIDICIPLQGKGEVGSDKLSVHSESLVVA